MGGRLSAFAVGVHGAVRAVDDAVVDAVLRELRGVDHVPQPAGVAVVVAEQQLALALDLQHVGAELGMVGLHRQRVRVDGMEARPFGVGRPGPGVAEPQRRQEVHRRVLRTSVGDGDPEADVEGISLGVLDRDVEVAPLVEHTGVDQLVLHLGAGPGSVGTDQVVVGKGGVRVLVQPALVGVGRQVVEVEVVLLHVLAVVALGVGQAEQALLQDRVALVPEGEREAQPLLVVAQAGQTVLAPVVGARPGLVVAEVLPGRAVVAVVLSHRAPLALAQVRAPRPPAHALAGLPQADLLGRQLHDTPP